MILKLNKLFIFIFFLLMLIVPTSFQVERGVTLIVINFFLLIGLLLKPCIFRLNYELFLVSLFCITTSIFFVFLGAVQGTPGYLNVATAYAAWPLLFTWMIGFVRNISILDAFSKLIITGIFLNSVIFIIFIANTFFAFFDPNNIFFSAFDLRGGISDEGYEFNFLGMGLYIYGLSYVGTKLYAFQESNITAKNISNKYYLIIFIICFGILLISGRRGFILAALFAVPICILICHLSEVRKINTQTLKSLFLKIPIFLIFIGLILSFILDYNLFSIGSYFLSGFEFNDIYNSSSSRRKEQFIAMISSWQENPFFGKGHGAFAVGAKGSGGQPWAYELQYVAILFQTGIVGFLIYFGSIIWLVYKAVLISKNNSEIGKLAIPATVALLSFLVANATNPYLLKFDYLWTLFFLAAIVNVGLIESNNRKKVK